jgi:cAMP phosphodiesterase
MSMKVGIVGSRTFTDLDLMKSAMAALTEHGVSHITIVSGGAVGADSLAREVARWLMVPIIEHFPDASAHGVPAAYFIRNQLIVDDADELFAFFGPGEPPSVNKSGTMDTVRKAMAKRIPVHMYFQP